MNLKLSACSTNLVFGQKTESYHFDTNYCCSESFFFHKIASLFFKEQMGYTIFSGAIWSGHWANNC